MGVFELCRLCMKLVSSGFWSDPQFPKLPPGQAASLAVTESVSNCVENNYGVLDVPSPASPDFWTPAAAGSRRQQTLRQKSSCSCRRRSAINLRQTTTWTWTSCSARNFIVAALLNEQCTGRSAERHWRCCPLPRRAGWRHSAHKKKKKKKKISFNIKNNNKRRLHILV